MSSTNFETKESEGKLILRVYPLRFNQRDILFAFDPTTRFSVCRQL